MKIEIRFYGFPALMRSHNILVDVVWEKCRVVQDHHFFDLDEKIKFNDKE